MKRAFLCGRSIALALLLLALATFAPSLRAQARPLITAPVDESKLVTLAGSRPAALKGATDLGVADESQPSGRLMVTLKRSPEQEASLQSFLLAAHQQSSPGFHKWLAPGEFGARFGAADSDVQQVTAWMQSHGLTVAKVSAGKTVIEFSGTVGQVNQAFHTSIHKYTTVDGATHYANATDPQVPAAFSAVVNGVTQLNDFKPTPLIQVMGQVQYNPKTHQGVPQWTIPNADGTAPLYLLTPEDFATQYDVKPLQAAGVTGAGVTIGIINDSNIDINLANAYRKLFGLPANPPQLVIDGNDPGITGDADEAYLDVENAGAVAPGATVKLYIGGTFGLLGDGGVNVAIARAVDDDAASILSLSFGTPEGFQSAAGNQQINEEWEQAAAQGQTVMVSAGDSGAASQLFPFIGLGVNGFASTPWNVAVGGTDAYFGDFATGGASIANFWSNTNDANLGSLQKPMSEQPWNGSRYGLNSIVYDPVANQTIIQGGGGGASSCAFSSPGVFNPFIGGTLPACIGGYPKPGWQVGPGVPNDKVRDLPDVSLFASDGFNGILWPFCAAPGDCTETNPTGGQPLVSGVGGTSASAPAMAGILALIEQKYGPQGQANYTLYPLAIQFPTAFNDLTVGSNNQPCTATDFELTFFGLANGCAPDTNGDGLFSLQHYSATAGYDQASGLGSIDVNQLYTNWGKLTYAPSTTTLTLTPTTSAHGQSVLANVRVTGNGVPSGPVALVTSTALPDNKGLGFVVLGSNGSVQQALTTLPGGTYTVTAEFNGDGINGPSQSQPVSVTVTPEASVSTLSAVYENLTAPSTGKASSSTVGAIAAGSSVPYGSDILFDASIAAASGSQGPPTGTVTFSDGSTVLGTAAVNAGGGAEFNASFLAPGSHTITATYNGDPSYNASTTAPLQFTITKVATVINVLSDDLARVTEPGGTSGIPVPTGTSFGYTVGQTPVILASLVGNSVVLGAGATGTLSFQVGSNAPVAVPVLPDFRIDGSGQDTEGGASQPFPNLAVGTYPLTISYSGDANFAPASIAVSIVVTALPAGALLPTTTTLTTNPANLNNIEPSAFVTFTMTVTGSGTVAPTGKVQLSYGLISTVNTFTLVPGSGNSSTATATVQEAALQQGNAVLFANYEGDSNYAASESASIGSFNDPSNFSFSALTPNVAIQSGSTGTAMLSLGSVNGFNGAVALTCAAPSALICTFSNATVNLNGTTTTNVTINTVTPGTAAAAANHPAQPKPFGRIVGSVLACMLLIVLPRRRRFGQMIASVLVVGVLLTAVGCHSALPPPATVITPTPPPPVDAANGTYSVVVTGTAPNGIVHDTTITVVVQ